MNSGTAAAQVVSGTDLRISAAPHILVPADQAGEPLAAPDLVSATWPAREVLSRPIP